MRRRKRESGSSGGSSGYLFPIGLGLGAVAAIALFFGLSVGPFDASREAAEATVASGKLPADRSAKNVAENGTSDASRTRPAESVAAAPSTGADTIAPADARAGSPAAPIGGDAGAGGLPSATDPETADLFGGRIAMVSSAVPRVVVLADGTNLVPGERLPSGHRLIGIERDRILLERDGAEWQVRLP